MNSKNIMSVAAIIGVAFLSGCSTNSAQKCPIDQNGYPSCSSMEKVFDHALNEDGDHLSVLPRETTSIEDEANLLDQSTVTQEVNVAPSVNQIKQNKMANGAIEHPYDAKPVYVPEKVHRMWFAPWTDEANNLRSAEMVYFTTKGYWNYGTLNSTGAVGGAMMEPLTPDDLGFNPDYSDSASNINNNHVKPEVTILGN